MSEQESGEVRASGTDLEALKGLVDFLAGDFYDAFEATKDIPSAVLRKVVDLDRIAEADRRSIYLELGAIFGLRAALEWAYREGLTYGYFSQREHVMDFLRLMTRATKALEIINDNAGNLNEAAARRVYMILQDIELGLQSLFLALLKHVHNGNANR
jgi:hypothetical protein